MLKIVAFLTLLATILALPVEDSNPKAQAAVQPLPQSDQLNLPKEPQGGLVLQQDGPLPNPPAQGSPGEDLKTDPTFWFGYRGYGYPIRRRSYYQPYYSSYYYYRPRSYYWGAPSYFW